MAVLNRNLELIWASSEDLGDRLKQVLTFGTATFPIRGTIAGMNIHNKNALVAILDRIDRQIIESDVLLLKLPTGGDLLGVTDELAYLQIERRRIAAKLETNR